jgi:hypothetical protein
MGKHIHMPTNLALDDQLIEEARRAGGHKTKKEAVTVALDEYVRKRLADLSRSHGRGWAILITDQAFPYNASVLPARLHSASAANHESGFHPSSNSNSQVAGSIFSPVLFPAAACGINAFAVNAHNKLPACLGERFTKL